MKVFAALALACGAGAGSAFSSGPAGCAAHGVGGSPTAVYAPGGYVVAGVRITGLGTSCAGRIVSVTLTAEAGRLRLVRLTGVVPRRHGTFVLHARHRVSAAAVTGVSVALNG